MTALQLRVRNAIRNVGDGFKVGLVSGVGVFSVVSPGYASRYLTDVQLDTLARPLRIATVPFDDATTAGATVEWNSLNLTVQKVVDIRHRGQTIARTLVLAPT
ncbi:MAG TPA: hypothetical protein PLH94_14665 [Fimbriimonadaceae bacterium]|nr:hypothetical protein [Fimbriimonadaceae bacterium]